MAKDIVFVRDLQLRTIIGIKEDERKNKQDVLINIVLYADLTAAGQSDSIDDTVNYRTITKQVMALVEDAQFFLVEKMAAEVINLCFLDPRVERAVVTIEKPGAVRFARSVGVTVDRTRADLSAT